MTRRPHVIAAVAIIAVGTGGCKKSEPPPRPPSIPIRLIESHRDAVSLWVGDGLVASQSASRKPVEPEAIRLSGPDGPLARTLAGWLVGVRGDRAFILIPGGPDGLDLAVAQVGVTGEPVVFGRVPGPSRFDSPDATVVDGVVAYAVGAVVYLIRPEQTRELPLLADSEVVTALVGNPTGPELVVGLEQQHGHVEGVPEQRLVLVDTRTGETRWQVALASPAQDGAAFVAGNRVLVPYDDEVVTYDLATGAATPRWGRGPFGVKTFVVDAAGDHLVFSDQIGDGHAAWADPTCVIRVLDDSSHTDALGTMKLTSFPGWCRLGMAFVGDTVWITP